MKSPSRTQIELNYNGKNVTDKIIDYLEDFVYTDVASGETDTLAISLSDEQHKWINSWFPAEGDYVEAVIKNLDWNKQGDNRKLKCGKFLIDDFDFKGPPDTYNLKGIASPINTGFASTTKNKTWNKTTVKTLASSIAKSAGVELVYDAPSYKIDKLEQSGETDISFLFGVCESYNLSMKLYNSKIIIFSETEYEKRKSIGKIDKNDCDTYTLNGTLVGTYHGVIIRYTKPRTNKTFIYKYMEKSGNRILSMKEKADSLADAELKAKAKLRKCNKQARTITLNLKGDIKYMAGTCYDITGFGKFNGKYYIDKVTHTLLDGYTASLQMHKVNS